MHPHPNIPESAWRFLADLAEHPAISSMILFGSRAFGDHDERSDVDVAIRGPQITRTEWARIREAAYHANSLYWITVVHYDRNPQRRAVLEHGHQFATEPRLNEEPIDRSGFHGFQQGGKGHLT